MWKCKYIETSAKEGTNVNELFEELLKLETSRTLSLQPIEENDKKKNSGKKGKCNLMWILLAQKNYSKLDSFFNPKYFFLFCWWSCSLQNHLMKYIIIWMLPKSWMIVFWVTTLDWGENDQEFCKAAIISFYLAQKQHEGNSCKAWMLENWTFDEKLRCFF